MFNKSKEDMTKQAPPPMHAPPATTAGNGSADVPAFLKDYRGPIGTENIDNEDVTIPRLKIAQAISDEVKEGTAKEGALFLNVTGQSLWNPGDPPLPALIVAQSKEYILWRPRQDESGGLLARAKPIRDQATGHTRYQWDQPNQSFDVRVEGKVKVTWKTGRYVDEDGLGDWGSEIPGDKESGVAATAHHNYLLLLPTAGNVIAAISLSRSGVKVAKNLNAAIKMGDPKYPLPVRKFTFTTVDDVGANGDKYKNWAFKPAGYLTDNDADLAQLAMKYFQEFRTGAYTVDQTDAHKEQAGSGTGENIPF